MLLQWQLISNVFDRQLRRLTFWTRCLIDDDTVHSLTLCSWWQCRKNEHSITMKMECCCCWSRSEKIMNPNQSYCKCRICMGYPLHFHYHYIYRTHTHSDSVWVSSLNTSFQNNLNIFFHVIVNRSKDIDIIEAKTVFAWSNFNAKFSDVLPNK